MAYPRTITERVDALIVANLLNSDQLAIRHYAGEFFDETTAKVIESAVSQYPTILYDIESIFDVPENNSSDSRMPEDDVIVVVYCCTANFASQEEQWISSYELAQRVRNACVGQSFDAVSDSNANSFFKSEGIEREFHTPKMSCHALRLRIRIPVQLGPEV